MKNAFKILLVVAATIWPIAFSQAKYDAPGIAKKIPLTIYDVVVETTEYEAKISWMTSSPSEGSVVISYEFDGVGYFDNQSGNRHEVTVPVSPGREYSYRIASQSDIYGSATKDGTFRTPGL